MCTNVSNAYTLDNFKLTFQPFLNTAPTGLLKDDWLYKTYPYTQLTQKTTPQAEYLQNINVLK